MNLYSIFPTAVAKFELGREYTAEENASVDSQETHKNQGNTTSNDRYVLRHDTMASLKAFVEASVGEYLRSIYAPKNEVGLRITQSWLNYCKPGEWHHKHAHPNSFISGVLYMKAARERHKFTSTATATSRSACRRTIGTCTTQSRGGLRSVRAT